MTEKTSLLMSQLQSCFESSTLDRHALNLTKKSVEEWFESYMLFQSNSYHETLEKLYSIGDYQLYLIISVPVDGRYMFHLLPHFKSQLRKVIYEPRKYLVESDDFQKADLGLELYKLKNLMSEVTSVLDKLTYRTRRATGANLNTVEYPPLEELRVFYECGRKASYLTKEDVAASLDILNVPYECEHCGQFHQGKPRKSSGGIPEEVKLVRYKAYWRRTHGI